MPLTRHLYREDEVLASLQLCCLRGRVREACFWALELLDSRMADEMIAALRRIWLYGFGVKAMPWWRAFEAAAAGESIAEEEFLGLTAELAMLASNKGNDCSVLALLGAAGSHAQPDRVNARKGGRMEAIVENFVELALWEGKTAAAWGAIRSLERGVAWKILGRVHAAKHGREGPGEQEGWEWMALAVAACCMTQKESAARAAWKPRGIPGHILEDIAEWQGLTGRRQRRFFPIGVDCLAWVTARGRELTVYDTNEKELMGRTEKPTALWGSVFWDEAAEGLGGWGAVRADDAAREEFYDTYFPDDIPDEWSKGERAKSHGGGVLQRGGAPDPARWVRSWFGVYGSCCVWDWLGATEAAVKGVSEGWDGLWAGVSATEVAGWDLRPAAGRRVEVA